MVGLRWSAQVTNHLAGALLQALRRTHHPAPPHGNTRALCLYSLTEGTSPVWHFVARSTCSGGHCASVWRSQGLPLPPVSAVSGRARYHWPLGSHFTRALGFTLIRELRTRLDDVSVTSTLISQFFRQPVKGYTSVGLEC